MPDKWRIPLGEEPENAEQLLAEARDGPVKGAAPVPCDQECQAERGVFADWQAIMIAAMRREGVTAARARRLAALVIASLEGTVAMCRAARSVQPLEDVRQELELVLSGAQAK